MIYGLGALLLVSLVYGPSLWVRYVMWKHSRDLDGMPGTGGELAEHLVERFKLDGVTVQKGEEGEDYYDPGARLVSLSPGNYQGKSLTAVAVAAHEVGHAIQFSRNEAVSQLRERYLGKAHTIKKFGTIILLSSPVIIAVVKVPHVFLLVAAAGVITMLASALMYVAILPEEYDASFNKALPILETGYIQEEHVPAVRQVLKAAALTYFAGALADTVSLWRWLQVFR